MPIIRIRIQESCAIKVVCPICKITDFKRLESEILTLYHCQTGGRECGEGCRFWSHILQSTSYQLKYRLEREYIL